ncbi:condensation domain-containing protein [Streptomyces subrutilus]|uniref:condensation domain-containing protein n=1 Tax=Streptomyces subrutilus TaxID=36818 RepID=UPI0033D94E43
MTRPALPLSFAQERMWFVDAAAPGNPTYNVPLFFRSRDRIDVLALSRALGAVVLRHEPLRTVFRLDGGRPAQNVLDPLPIAVETVDLGGVPDAESVAREAALARGRAPFDLAEGPLLRCTVWQAVPGGDAVLLTVHHIAVDGWSLAPLFDDLALAYTAELAGAPATFPELPTTYAEFAVRERSAEAEPELRRATGTRVAELLELPPGLALAGRAPGAASPEGTRPGRQYTRTVPRSVHAHVADLARSLRVTPYVVLGAAVQTVLHRWSGRSDFLLGTMTANRLHPDLEELVGFFVNTVPLRCRVDAAGSFADLCAAARREAFRSLTHQRIPYDRLTAAVTRARGAGQRALVDIGFVYQNTSAPRTAGGRWSAPAVLPTGTAKFDLLLILEETPDGLSVTVEYDTDRYPPETAAAVADGLADVLAHAVKDPTVPLAELPALPGEPAPGALPPLPELPPLAAPGPAAGPAAGAPALTAPQARAAELFAAALSDRAGAGPAAAELAPGADFFALGGHSLLAVTMLAEAKRRHGLTVSPRDFLPDPTVAGLAALLAAAEADAEARAGNPPGTGAAGPDGAPAVAAPVADDESHPASPVQQRFWFLDRLPSLRSAYLIPTVVEYAGPVDRDALRAAVDLVLARHPALRSLFHLDRRKRQVHYTTAGTPAVCGLGDAADWSAARLRGHLSGLCWTPVDLARESPARAEVIGLGAERTLLVLVVHHIIADGWSRDLLLAEIATSYRALRAGDEPELPVPVHPATVAAADPGAGADASGARAAAVLLEHLRGAPNDIALPHDWPRGELQTTDAGLCAVRLDPGVAARLRAVTTDELGCTLFMTAAALLAVALARGSGQRDFLFAFPWAGREAAASTEAVGMFVNTLVLRVDLRDDPTWRELLARVRDSSTVSYRHAQVPLDTLAAELHPDRDLSRPSLTPVYLSAQTGVPAPPPLDGAATGHYRPLDPLYLKYELELVATENADHEVELAASYATDLFAASTVGDLLAEVAAAAGDLAADPASHPLIRRTP